MERIEVTTLVRFDGLQCGLRQLIVDHLDGGGTFKCEYDRSEDGSRLMSVTLIGKPNADEKAKRQTPATPQARNDTDHA